MSTFKVFLKENEEFQEKYADLIATVKRDCKEWLSEADGKPTYRGMKDISGFTNGLKDKTVRKDRKPLNSKDFLHKMVGEELEKKFGFNPRTEAVFVSGKEYVVKYYGTPYVVIPKGKLEYVYNPKVDDITGLYTIEDIDNPGINYLPLGREDMHTVTNYIAKVVHDMPEDVFKKVAQPYIDINGADSAYGVIYKKMREDADYKPTLDDIIKTRYVFINTCISLAQLSDKTYYHKIARYMFEEVLLPLYKNTDLKDGLEAYSEIMVRCDSYFIIDPAVVEDVGGPAKFMSMLK